MTQEIREDIIAKAAALRLIDDESLGKKFLLYLDVNFIAPEIVYLFQNLAYTLFTIFTSAAGAYLLYVVKQKRDEKIYREKLVNEVRSILENHYEEINSRLKDIEDQIGHFDRRYKSEIETIVRKRKKSIWQSKRKIRRQVEKECIAEDEAQLSAFRVQIEKLKDSDSVVDTLLKLIEREYKKNPKSLIKYINKFRGSRTE